MGTLNIPRSSLVYLDTSIIIYSVEKLSEYYSLLEPIWIKLKTREIEVITCELTLLEALVLPIKTGNLELIKTYKKLLLSSEIQLAPITRSILTDAANLRATKSLKTPDAIHAATAQSSDCNIFLTNDMGFRNLTDLNVIILSQVLKS